MKKSFLSSIFIVLSILMNANPIASPTIGFNELYFDSDTNWVIELYFIDFNSGFQKFGDSSLIITSSKDTAFIKKISFSGEQGLVIIRKENLFSDFYILIGA